MQRLMNITCPQILGLEVVLVYDFILTGSRVGYERTTCTEYEIVEIELSADHPEVDKSQHLAPCLL